MTNTFKRALPCGLVLAAMAASPVAAQPVGKMTAERSTVTKAGVGPIGVGAGIDLGDRLSSNASGAGIIVFRDESSARLGPNADLTIDAFVYDPGRRGGTIRLRQQAGTARIFGGQISKRGTSEVVTPHIVLGVRGGIVTVDVDEAAGTTTAKLEAGIMECQTGAETIVVTNPGTTCTTGGGDIDTDHVEGAGRTFVDPGSGSGGNPGPGSYGHCASAAGATSGACGSSDGGLPTPMPGANALNGGGTPGGTAPFQDDGGNGDPGNECKRYEGEVQYSC